MFRRNLRKIIPSYAVFPLILTGIMNLLSYQAAKLVQLLANGSAGLDMTSAADKLIPFVPAWVWAYVLTYIFWAYQYITVAQESPELCCRLAAADFVAKVVGFFFFVFLPTTNIRPEIAGGGVNAWLMNLIYTVDTPTNLFPSAHCYIAWIGTRYMFECRHLRHRIPISIACVIGSLLVFASTLFTKQHGLYDVIGGVALAEIGWLVARYTKLPRLIEKANTAFQNTRLSKIL
ncbi:MAG: hypothetical protein LBM28_05545 [Oscillospiraceae bacterium]|jgi:membrane-associated phospholipid phosphatase|nr:hypothetical protein [Oscillospiraceae bacterium]